MNLKNPPAVRTPFLLLLILGTVTCTARAEETRYPGKWEWPALQANEIKNLTKSVRTSPDGFWEVFGNGVGVRSNVSGPLAAEANIHLARAISVFPQTIKLPPSATRIKDVRFMLTIHKSEESFSTAAPGTDSEAGFRKISSREDGGSLAEIHLVSNWDLHPGFDNNLVECIDVGLLQGHLAKLLLHLWRPDQPLPPFMNNGYASYFETYDVYQQKPRTNGIHRSDFRAALHHAIQEGAVLRPSMSGHLHMPQAEFGKNPELNGALASRFVHFIMPDMERQKIVHQLLGASTGAESTKLDFKAAAALEQDWHRDLYRTVALSRPVLHSQLSTDGKVPGAASVTKISNYGNKPLLSLIPVQGGNYDIAWHNSSNGSIHIMQCDSQNRKTAEFSPSFIQKAGALLGATRLPDDKGYVVGYCTDNSHGNKDTEFWIAGFGLDGSERFNTRIFGERNLKEVKSKGGPGGAGSARIVYNEKTKTIAFYLSHNMLWEDGVRHQGGYVGFLNEKGKQQSGGNTWFYSHNFDQRLIVADGDFCALAHGDAYPRALGFSRWPGSGGKAITNQTYHDIPGESGDNTTNCQTGGLVALPRGRYAIVFASSNGRESHDVCLKILDESGKTTEEKWLTNLEKGSQASYPRIARDGDHVFVAWHEGSSMRQMVLDRSLNVIVPASTSTSAKLSPYDDLHNLDNGAIIWAVPAGGNKIQIHRIDQPATLEKALLDRSTRKQRSPKAEAIQQVDHEMTIKLAELSADGNLPKAPISLPSAKSSAQLSKVDKTGMLHFLGSAESNLRPVAFSDMPLPDRAFLTLALTEVEPDNLFLFGIAGFYLECSGSSDAAIYYYGRSGQTAADQFSKFFE